MKVKALVVLSLYILCASSFSAITAKKLYFTTNTLSSGPSVYPGFEFRYIWNGIGQGKNDHLYVGISNKSESEGGGDVCVVEYNPYANTMKSVGTIIKAYQAAQNWGSGEYCNKVHTWFCGTPDGKVWMGSEDGGRGGHLLYVDTQNGNKLVDYSKNQKYIYLYNNPFLPVLNHPEQPPSGSNGIALQDYSFKIMNLNPHNPRYIWTESYGNLYYQYWDVEADSTRAFPGGHKDMRAFLVDKDGSLWYQNGQGVAYKRSVTGQLKIVGRGLGYLPNSYVYSHSYDTGYTAHRIDGEIVMCDFVNDTAVLLADMPNGGGYNQTYRAITISRDGKSLYILGGDGIVYELNIATRQYQNIGSISGSLAGSYALSSGHMDSLGNWYITCFGNATYILQVHLGKDKIKPLVIPDPAPAVEEGDMKYTLDQPFSIHPNPFNGILHISMKGTGAVYGIDGRLVKEFKNTGQHRKTFIWNPVNAPAGLYIVRVKIGKKVFSRKVLLQR
jgi:hypothetical protein